MSEPNDFLRRWSRRKAQHRSNERAQPQDDAPAPVEERSQAADATQADHQAPAAGKPTLEPRARKGGSPEAADSTPSSKPADRANPVVGNAAGADTDGADTAATGASRPDRAGTGAPELPSLDSLTPESDFRPFMNAGVDPATRGAALKRLFADPHFNRMDGLDIYIDDYGKSDPIPLSMLKMLDQARALRLFDDEETGDDAKGAAPSTPVVPEESPTARSPDAPMASAPAGDQAGPAPSAGGGGTASHEADGDPDPAGVQRDEGSSNEPARRRDV